MFKLKIEDQYNPTGEIRGYQLSEPFAESAPAGSSMWGNEFQLNAGNPFATTGGTGLSSGAIDAIGGGIGAAGAMASTLAQLAAQKAAMDRAAETNSANNAQSEKLAKMQLAASQEAFERQQRLSGNKMLMDAVSGQSNTGRLSQRAKGEALDLMSAILQRAMLPSRGRR